VAPALDNVELSEQLLPSSRWGEFLFQPGKRNEIVTQRLYAKYKPVRISAKKTSSGAYHLRCSELLARLHCFLHSFFQALSISVNLPHYRIHPVPPFPVCLRFCLHRIVLLSTISISVSLRYRSFRTKASPPPIAWSGIHLLLSPASCKHSTCAEEPVNSDRCTWKLCATVQMVYLRRQCGAI
jgi:hypothetical protein